MGFVQASVIADALVLYVCKGRAYYRKKKYLQVNNPGVTDYVYIEGTDASEAETDRQKGLPSPPKPEN